VRTWRFWLAVAPASPMVFGSIALAIVVLPEDVTSARTLSAGFAGLMTVLAFSAGVAIQPFARRFGNPLAGVVAGLCCAAAGAGVAVAAVTAADRVLAGVAAVLLGLAYGLSLVSGLRQVEQMAGPTQRGAVVACYYALAYLGFAAPYLAAGLGAVSGQAGAFGVLAGIALVIAAGTAGYGLRRGRADRAADPPVLCSAGTTGTRT
jgi:MFS family permease